MSEAGAAGGGSSGRRLAARGMGVPPMSPRAVPALAKKPTGKPVRAPKEMPVPLMGETPMPRPILHFAAWFQPGT